ncbi:hypothetical protein ABMA32_01630 [Mesorhizobium sp. VNQ89]|uniref:hypothetical protein n=1 Tax=Mesorhizobium quangtriensis TaxID=3157709 RepID=UPI0032B78BBF
MVDRPGTAAPPSGRWPWPAGLLLSLIPTSALAHASDRGHVLLLPTGHYIIGGALAVAASFLVLLLVRPETLERLAAGRLTIGPAPDALRLPLSLLSFLVLAILVLAGVFGSRDPLSNPLSLTIWTLLWVGLTLLQGLLGNLWSWINPWYGPHRIASALLGKSVDAPPLRLPAWAGLWPAVVLFLGFAWFELIDPAPEDPLRLAWAVGGYWLFNFAMMLLFGFEAWAGRCEFLSVFFGMVARFGVVGREDDEKVSLRLPSARLLQTPALALSSTVFLLFTLASVSFDGLSRTFFWFALNGLNPLEFPGRTALIAINGVGLAIACVLLALVFFACVFLGEKLAGTRRHFAVTAGTFVWSIVPIALAYHFSHYLTVLLVNSQYALVAFSDPFSLGWDLFGTAHMPVRAAVAAGSDSAWVIWNAQAAAIVGGHVLAVLVAHMLAYRLHGTARAATLSQLPLTILMIAYTVLGLWLLSTPTAA